MTHAAPLFSASAAPAASATAQDARPLDDFLCFAVYSAGLAFNRLYKPLLDRLGLTYPQYLVMVSLARRDDQTVSALGEGLFLESSTLTPLIKRLEAAGLVSRRRDRADERVVRVTLTPRGRALMADAACIPMEIGAAADLSTEQVAQMRETILHLRAALRAGAT
jgi:DNA-binding MarR family transcriptional regulator